MPAQNHSVRKKFAIYRRLLEQKKQVEKSPLLLKPKKNNANWLMVATPLLHPTITNESKFIAAQNSQALTRYELKIMAPFLCEEPCFRFESEGPAHRNDFMEIPLPERQITTPHFHRFNSEGYQLAYKTDTLKNEKNCHALKRDINFGVAHFCQEGNIRHGDDGFPQVETDAIALPLPNNFDPLNGVSFRK